MKRITLLAVVMAVALWSSGAVAAVLHVSPSDPGRDDGAAAGVIGLAAGAPLASPETATDIKNLNTGLEYPTIAAALADVLTLDGHVLDVQVSPHSEGIVNVTKSVTILGGGGGGAIIMAAASTGSSGDARGWFLVSASNVTFQNVTLDGTGYNIYQAIRRNGAGLVVDQCTLQHIQYPGYNGVAVAAMGNASVTACTFTDIGRIGVILFGPTVTSGLVSGCTYTGKGPVDGLDYGIELGGGAVATITGNTITECTGVALSDGSGSAGVLVTTYFGAGTTGTLGNNFLADNSVGVYMGYDTADASTVTAFNNDLSNNPEAGAVNTSATNRMNASGNWWGSADPGTVWAGRYGDVDYTPWLAVGTDVGGDPANGFQGDFSTLWVDDDSPQVGAVARIQEGISLVTASTVFIAPGSYPGNVIVNTVVTLDGAGDGANPAVDTILLPPVATTGIDLQVGGGSLSNRVVIKDLRVSGTGNAIRTDNTISHVTLDNLTLTGSGSYGIEIHNSAVVTDLVMNDCDLVGNSMGMRVRGALDGLVVTGGHFDGNTYGMQSVVGVGNDFKNVSITGTTFNNNTSKGMYFEKLSDAVFDGITVSNSGTVGAWAAGIDINLKYAAYQNIEIKNSTVSGCGSGDPINGVGLTVKARDDGGYAGFPATLDNVDITNVMLTGNQCGLRFGEPTKNNAGPTGVDVHQCEIAGSIGYGLDNQSQATPDAACNWWGDILGPNVPLWNPSPGDDLTGPAVYVPWLDGPISGTPLCNQYGANYVSADPTGLCLNPGIPAWRCRYSSPAVTPAPRAASA